MKTKFSFFLGLFIIVLVVAINFTTVSSFNGGSIELQSVLSKAVASSESGECLTWLCYDNYKEPAWFVDDYYSISCGSCVQVFGHDFWGQRQCLHCY